MTFYKKCGTPMVPKILCSKSSRYQLSNAASTVLGAFLDQKITTRVKMYNFAQISCVFENFNFWGQNRQKLLNFKTLYKSNEKSYTTVRYGI